jgi:hypothetical protein
MAYSFPNVAHAGAVNKVVTVDLESVPAMAFDTQTVTVAGLRPDMVPVVNMPSLEAGLLFVSAQIKADNTLTITLFNGTVAAINPASQQIVVVTL